MKRLDDFIEVNRLGSHCGSSALRVIMQGNGYDLSEDMCLGLGSGLGFIYQRYLTVDYYFFTGRNESLQENLAGVLGARLEAGRTDDPEVGWLQAKELVDAGIPVMLDLDMMYLPYLVEHAKLDRPFHFGLHNAILVGYDESRGTVLLLDYLWREPKEVSMEQLAAARNSQTAPVKPENAWKALIAPTEKRDLHTAVREAIDLNIHRMRYPFAFKMGLPGLKMFAREIRKWPEQMTPDELMNNAYMAAELFERIGTGGGNFRRMYARFLKEVYWLTGQEIYQDCSAAYMELFRRWRRVAKLFEEGAADPGRGIFADDPAVDEELRELVDLEYAAIDRLELAVRSY